MGSNPTEGTKEKNMFIFDAETLSKKSTSVILSFACIYFNPDEKPDHVKLKQDAFFVKFKAREQAEMGRHIGKTTLEWWVKQCENVKKKSFLSDPERDVSFIEGYESFRKWVNEKNDPNCWVWARGNLDQLVMDDIEEQLHIEPVFKFNRWRDVRTAIDFLYSTTTGYVDVDHPKFKPSLHVTKHDPVDDCVYDAMMLMYGKSIKE